MILLFFLLPIFASLACLPGFIYANYLSRPNHEKESVWFIFSSVPALTIWILLILSNVGAPGEESVVEIFQLTAIGTIGAYFKMIIVDRFLRAVKRNTYLLVCLLCVVAIALRLL